MRQFLRALCGLFFALALAALALLLLSDIWMGFMPAPRHFQAESLALIFVGISFVCLQLSTGNGWRDMLKGLLLGLAFVLWGSEKFMPQGPCVIATDTGVIAIFILDLGLIIAGHLGGKAQAAPVGETGK
jgi:hypothetical protein